MQRQCDKAATAIVAKSPSNSLPTSSLPISFSLLINTFAGGRSFSSANVFLQCRASASLHEGFVSHLTLGLFRKSMFARQGFTVLSLFRVFRRLEELKLPIGGGYSLTGPRRRSARLRTRARYPWPSSPSRYGAPTQRCPARPSHEMSPRWCVHYWLDRAKGVSGPNHRTCDSERRRKPLGHRGQGSLRTPPERQ